MQVLQGHMQLALADAQSITVLRAVQKGNAPSLVAALALDTANMYQAAAQAFKQIVSTGPMGSKAGRYAEWKLLVFQGYMYAFTGQRSSNLVFGRPGYWECRIDTLHLLHKHVLRTPAYTVYRPHAHHESNLPGSAYLYVSCVW